MAIYSHWLLVILTLSYLPLSADQLAGVPKESPEAQSQPTGHSQGAIHVHNALIDKAQQSDTEERH